MLRMLRMLGMVSVLLTREPISGVSNFIPVMKPSALSTCCSEMVTTLPHLRTSKQLDETKQKTDENDEKQIKTCVTTSAANRSNRLYNHGEGPY